MMLWLLLFAATAQAQDWTTDDCTLRAGAYHVVGEGATLDQARVKARESALLCVFGGDYQSNTEVNETGSTAKYAHSIGVTLSVTGVDWTGFSQENVLVKDRSFVQYRWEEKAAKASKAKFERWRENALKAKALRAAHPGAFLGKLVCGTTFSDVTEALGPPTEVGCDGGKSAKTATWGEFQLSAETYGQEAATCDGSFAALANVRVTWITRGYGHGDTKPLCWGTP